MTIPDTLGGLLATNEKILLGRLTQTAQGPAGDAEHSGVRTTPPPLRRRVEGRAALLADEVRALAERSTDLLARIDELCSGAGPMHAGDAGSAR